MTARPSLIAPVLLLAAAAAAGPLVLSQDLPLDAPLDVARLQRLIAPSDEDLAWQRLPWSIDLLEARGKAAREGKPLFLWEMDGHPLGCT